MVYLGHEGLKNRVVAPESQGGQGCCASSFHPCRGSRSVLLREAIEWKCFASAKKPGAQLGEQIRPECFPPSGLNGGRSVHDEITSCCPVCTADKL
ncbi:hypothetical protein NQZ68_019709 [Dissostichus eleginoides]|nr:hypothetical protein NQZ68_019709 [Dissostichus eleginoides]